MQNFEYYRPTKYVLGRNAENKIGDLIKEYGFKKVMLVYGGSNILRSGLLDRILEIFNQNKIAHVTLSGVKPNPRADLVYDGIQLARSQNVDLVLAVGGGSVIDTAKAIALGVLDDGDFFDFFTKERKPHKALKTGVILTFPGSGSEGSNGCVIEKKFEETYIKRCCVTDLNTPLFALLNPELTFSLSSYQTACGITDMFSHILGRYFTNTPNVSLTDHLCEAVMLSIKENASIVMRDPENYDARANLMWASTLANNDVCGLDREQDWSCHHLENQLSAFYDLPHGAGMAVIFPSWMEFTYKHDVMRFAQFANRVFGCAMNFDEPEITARAGISALRHFFKNLGMPLSFADIKARADDIPQLLNMLGVDDVYKTEGKFMPLHRSECEIIYKNAANYKA